MANSHFFPSTEPAEGEAEDEWEDVEEGESAENGAPVDVEAAAGSKTEYGTSKVELPEVPKAEPADDGPLPKKQKPNAEAEEKR